MLTITYEQLLLGYLGYGFLRWLLFLTSSVTRASAKEFSKGTVAAGCLIVLACLLIAWPLEIIQYYAQHTRGKRNV